MIEANVWPVEPVPDEDNVYYRVPVAWLRAGAKPHPLVFKENKGAMSVDWEKYSTAAETRARPGRPERFAILKMNVGGIRGIVRLNLEHDPVNLPDGTPPAINRAHSGVKGIELPSDISELGYKERVQLDLLNLTQAKWEIAPGEPIR